MYIDVAKEKLKNTDIERALILSIETSCDETAVALTVGRTVLSSVISSQIEIHRRFGGVVPEIASRNHVTAIGSITREALQRAGKTLAEVDIIAVTYGAGLLGALLVGVGYAKALAFSLAVPLIGIDHIKGHVFASHIAYPDLKPPYITLLASGGHTAVLRVRSYFDCEVLGETRDDAAGEAFDKVARALGLSYPGGPEIEKLALLGKPTYRLPRALKSDTETLDFSYSGLKTAIVNLLQNAEARGEKPNKADVARSFEEEAVSVLVEHAVRAAKKEGIKTVTLAGGVGANSRLRQTLEAHYAREKLRVYLPPKELCTDNAAMIGIACYEALKSGIAAADLTLDANPSL